MMGLSLVGILFGMVGGCVAIFLGVVVHTAVEDVRFRLDDWRWKCSQRRKS